MWKFYEYILAILGESPMLLSSNDIEMSLSNTDVAYNYDNFSWWIMLTNLITIYLIVYVLRDIMLETFRSNYRELDMGLLLEYLLMIGLAGMVGTLLYLFSPVITIIYTICVVIQLIVWLGNKSSRDKILRKFKIPKKKKKKLSKVEKYKEHLTKTSQLN